jgi:phage baseplate assembly protein V
MDSPTDLYRLLNNLIRFGTVAEVDASLCRVQSGEVLTDFLPWLALAAGDAVEWSAPTTGEQVVVLSPEGDLSGAVVLRGLYSHRYPTPVTDPAIHLRQYPDGAQISYNSRTHALAAILPTGATAVLTADGGVTINGPLAVNGNVTIEGNTEISGTANAQTDVVGAGISLKDHAHGGVQPGGGNSGPPA